MKTDSELLEEYAKHGAETAFADLVARHLSLVYSAALRLVNGDAHLAQDITQTVFTDLARKAQQIAERTAQRREALPGWLFTSTRFAAATAIRANQRRRKYEEQKAHADVHDREDVVSVPMIMESWLDPEERRQVEAEKALWAKPRRPIEEIIAESKAKRQRDDAERKQLELGDH